MLTLSCASLPGGGGAQERRVSNLLWFDPVCHMSWAKAAKVTTASVDMSRICEISLIAIANEIIPLNTDKIKLRKHCLMCVRYTIASEKSSNSSDSFYSQNKPAAFSPACMNTSNKRMPMYRICDLHHVRLHCRLQLPMFSCVSVRQNGRNIMSSYFGIENIILHHLSPRTPWFTLNDN